MSSRGNSTHRDNSEPTDFARLARHLSVTNSATPMAVILACSFRDSDAVFLTCDAETVTPVPHVWHESSSKGQRQPQRVPVDTTRQLADPMLFSRMYCTLLVLPSCLRRGNDMSYMRCRLPRDLATFRSLDKSPCAREKQTLKAASHPQNQEQSARNDPPGKFLLSGALGFEGCRMECQGSFIPFGAKYQERRWNTNSTEG
jgi:hypothetical protein